MAASPLKTRGPWVTADGMLRDEDVASVYEAIKAKEAPWVGLDRSRAPGSRPVHGSDRRVDRALTLLKREKFIRYAAGIRRWVLVEPGEGGAEPKS